MVEHVGLGVKPGKNALIETPSEIRRAWGPAVLDQVQRPEENHRHTSNHRRHLGQMPAIVAWNQSFYPLVN